MFGFGKKKEPVAPERAKRSQDFEQRKAQSKAQLGMFMGLDEEESGGAASGGGGGGASLDLDDAELEKELLLLLGGGGGGGGGSPIKQQKRSSQVKIVPKMEVEVQEGSDFEEDEEGECDVDFDDPDLHAELGEILGDPGVKMESIVEFQESAPPTLPPPLVPARAYAPQPPPKPSPSSQELPAAPTEDLFHAPAAPITILEGLEQRRDKYKSEVDKATAENNTSKARRMGRIVKQYEDAIISYKKGKVVVFEDLPTPPGFAPIPVPSASNVVAPETTSNSEIPPTTDLLGTEQPPESAITSSRPLPSPPTSPVTRDTAVVKTLLTLEEETQLQEVLLRQKQYRDAALEAKKNGEIDFAKELLRVSKGFDSIVEFSKGGGGPVDFSTLPPHPDALRLIHDTKTPVVEPPSISEPPSQPQPPPAPTEDLFHAPTAPTSILEALEQRLDKYKSEVDKGNETNNSSKARRMGRIVKQYEDAIALYKKGKVVPFEDLPTPPGFAPIPVPTSAAPTPSTSDTINTIQVRPAPAADDSPPKPSTSTTPPRTSLSPPTSSINRGAGKPVSKLTLQEKQLQEVLLRQKQYRDAAIEAKKNGDIAQAREYLRVSKGFDNLIEASKGGLPVDLKTLPAPPGSLILLEAEDFELVSAQDCIVAGGNLSEVYAKLEEDLKSQLKMCMRTREHFRNIGDIPSANRFEGMALDTKRDLDALRVAARTGQNAPKYHYENKVFSITECNTDIKQDEIEVTVVRGINYKATSSIDTFVRVELPYPSAEEAQSQKSGVVRDSIDPEYNATYKMNINRSARNFQRFIHRHGVKIEVWSKGGFLRSSSLLGVATVKLQPLENKTTLHDAFDLLDGRKVVGKLEVKVRLRDPVLTKEISQRKEKWLSIDRS